MTGDEMERGIEFLLRSQAKLESQIAETNKIVQLHTETQTEFIKIVTRHIEAQGEINASLRAAINQADEKINRTDTRLDRLEALIERYIEGRNGQG